MTREQQLMITGMDMLLRKFTKMSGHTEVTVDEIIAASNEVYDAILSNGELNSDSKETIDNGIIS